MTARQPGQARPLAPQDLLQPLYLDAWRSALAPASDSMIKQTQRWNALGQMLVDEAQALAKGAAEHVEAVAGLQNQTARAMFASGGLAEIAELNAQFARELLALGTAEASRQGASMSRLMSAAWRQDSVA